MDPLTEAALDLLGIVQDRGDRNMVLRTLGGFRNLLTEDDVERVARELSLDLPPATEADPDAGVAHFMRLAVGLGEALARDDLRGAQAAYSTITQYLDGRRTAN